MTFKKTLFNLSTKRDPNLEGFPASDLHCHTYYSDGCINLKELVKRAKHRGFDFVAKADHNTCKGNLKLKKICEDNGLMCIPGIEISTNMGHLLAVNIWEWPHKGLNLEETIEQIHKQNGIAIMAHPWWRQAKIRFEVFKYKTLDGFEGLNGSSLLGNHTFLKEVYHPKKMKKMNPHNLIPYSNSDSHAGYTYGDYYNVFLTNDDSVDGILESMRKGLVRGIGPFYDLKSFLIDGAINQPVQLKKLLFYKDNNPKY